MVKRYKRQRPELGSDSVNSPDSSLETPPILESPDSGSTEPEANSSVSPEPDPSIGEYYRLQRELFITTLILTGIAFIPIWIFYSLNVALNYLIGACTGVVYLRMLARNVEQLGREKQQLSKARLALLVGVILVASRWDQLQIMPIFLGFLTYKIAVIFYMLRTTILPDSD